MIDFFRVLLRTPQGAIGILLVVLSILVALFGPHLSPYDPERIASHARFETPSLEHFLGTDHFGRDILSRLLTGARSTILLSILATLIGTVFGSAIGTSTAFFGGRIDEAIMRTVDAVMAIPLLIVAMLIADLLGRNTVNTLLAIGIALIPGMTRITRSIALSVRNQEFVQAAIARGEPRSYIIFREMYPNVLAPVIIETTIRISFAIMLFATLSYLGLGPQPPAAEWGLMAAEARRYLHLSVWMILWPSVAIAVVAIGFNLLGDGLRDAVNTRLR